MGSTNRWFDSEGQAVFWRGVPIRTIKKAFFTRGTSVVALAKMVLNSTTYDFAKTAQGGAVIVPPGYSAIEFVSPDGRIDYNALLRGSLGNALTQSVQTLNRAPVPSWDHFAKWFADTGVMEVLAGAGATCALQTIDGTISVPVSIPNFSNVTNMAEFLNATKNATTAANSKPLSLFQLDNAAFGWAMEITSAPNEEGATSSLKVGFLFRE